MHIEIEELIQVLSQHGYKYEKQIGEGGNGTAHLVTSLKYQSQFCCKVRQVFEKSDRKGKYIFYSKPDGNMNIQKDDNDQIDIQNPDLTDLDAEIALNIKLQHPNIISLFEHFTENNFLYIIMEYCPNGNLDEYIKNNGPLKPPLLYSMAYKLVDALMVCHENLIAHRDIKPSNIFLDLHGRPKLADFGISCELETITVDSNGNVNRNVSTPLRDLQKTSNSLNNSRTTLSGRVTPLRCPPLPRNGNLQSFPKLNQGSVNTNSQKNVNTNSHLNCHQYSNHESGNSGICKENMNKNCAGNNQSGKRGQLLITRRDGSRPWMAPEIFENSKFDPFKADIWALGVTFYQMATGRLPWQTADFITMKKNISLGLVIFDKGICPREFQRIIKRMVDPSLAKRASLESILNDPLFQNIQPINISPPLQLQPLGRTRSNLSSTSLSLATRRFSKNTISSSRFKSIQKCLSSRRQSTFV